MYKFLLTSIFVLLVKFSSGQITVTVEQACYQGRGSISINASSSGTYFIYITGPSTTISDGFSSGSYVVDDLLPGTYSVSVDRFIGYSSSSVYYNNSLVINPYDTSPPVFQNPQANITANTSSTSCGAIITYASPTVTDNCFPRTGTITNYTYLGQYGGHYYYLSNNTLNATNSASYSASLGGHLVTINSQGENDWLNNLVGAIWIGLNDATTEGSFTWITGEPIGYVNWNGGQPDDYWLYGGEDYVEMNSYGYWNDLTGSDLLHYVVEFEPITVTQTAGLASGSFFPKGTTTNTFTATDGSGNSSTMSFSVIIADVTPPTFTIPNNSDVGCIDSETIVVNGINITNAADNCTSGSGFTIEYRITNSTNPNPLVNFGDDSDGDASGYAFPIGLNTITYKLSDFSTNSTEKSFTINVKKNADPKGVFIED